MADGSSTWVATPNIALIKYWGRRDAALNLPCNSSISITLGEEVQTKTSVDFDPKLARDELFLNGKKAGAEETKRAARVLNVVREKAGIAAKARVVSSNNFPTKAGIASSASGFAALACASCDAAGLKMGRKELSILARMGSGSACRSVLGGFVEWKAGKQRGGRDSYSVQLAQKSHWKGIVDIVAITDAGRKKIGSEKGMDITVKTSKLFKKRLLEVPSRLSRMRRAIRERDFEALAALCMEDSDSMHASMAESRPPIVYLNETSKKIMRVVREMNARGGRSVAGYTFDAGPNAHVITRKKDAKKVGAMLRKIRGVERLFTCGVGGGPRKAAY